MGCLPLRRKSATTTYTYDNSGRLTGSNLAGALSTYVYDANGNIEVKHDAGKQTTYIWDGSDYLCEDTTTWP